jgi:hypothetical protein
MLLPILVGMIGLVVVIEAAIVVIHSDLHGRLRRPTQKKANFSNSHVRRSRTNWSELR